MMKRDLDDFKVRLDFASALNQMAAKIKGDPYPHEDSPEDLWFGTVQLDKPFQKRVTVHAEDEESKLNLNQAPEGLLSAFFKQFEDSVGPLKGSRRDYVKGISKRRSPKRIQSLEDLLLMEDFETEDLEALRPYMTVYPESPLVNINTANPLILKSLLNFLSGDTGAKQIFLGRLEEACSLDQEKISKETRRGCFFRSRDLMPELFAEKLKLPKTPVMLSLVQEFLSQVTMDSETFRVSIKTVSNRGAMGIFRYRVGQPRPEVLWWHEE